MSPPEASFKSKSFKTGKARKKAYDFALSFAGEDRFYVSQVAEYIHKRGFDVFYDSFFDVELWGKDLIAEFDKIYRMESHLVILFISRPYLKKEWTTLERRSALAGAMKSASEYVLPVRFDNTELPGLPPTVAYQDARVTSAEALAEMIIKKLNQSGRTPKVTRQKDGLLAWRIGRAQFVSDLDGRGFEITGGRWNNVGISMIYCSSSYCASFMERFVHGGVTLNASDIVATQLLIPPEVSIQTIYEESLPRDWRNRFFGGPSHTSAIGSEWVQSKTSCVLSVPSTVMPYERVLLLNPLHPEIKKVKVGLSEAVFFDPRLVQSL